MKNKSSISCIIGFVFKAVFFVVLLVGMAFVAQATTFTYNTSGTWVVPSGVTSVTFEIWGGGGGGGGASGNGSFTNGTTGGGGGGGGYSVLTLNVVAGNTYVYTVGASGAGGSGGGSATAASGGATSISGFGITSFSAAGGTGGHCSPTDNTNGASGTGGTGVGGSTNRLGGNGSVGTVSATSYGGGGGGAGGNGSNGSNGAAGTGAANGGAGGSVGTFTAGGNGGTGWIGSFTGGAGTAGAIPGGGGGGGGSWHSNVSGGAGGSGQVKISYTSSSNTISSFSPSTACVGATITIIGTNLASASAVTIGGTPVASIVSNTATQLVVVLGAGSTGVVSVTNMNGTATSATNFTLLTIPSTPGSISGSALVCASSIDAYSILTMPGVTSYTWSFPSGWSGSSSTNNISLTAGSSNGSITVSASNACGTSPLQTLNVSILPLPQSPDSILGALIACAGVATTFSVPPVTNASSYAWTLPIGWIGTSSSSSINPLPGSAGGVISVIASNACGNSAAQTTNVTVLAIPNIPDTILGALALCEGSLSSFSVDSVLNASTYNWTLPVGWNGSSTSTLVSATAGTSGGVLSVSAENQCGASAAQTLAVTVSSMPLVSFAFIDSVCSSATAFALTGGSPAGGAYSGSGVSAGIFTPAQAGIGVHELVYTYINGACSNSDTAIVYVDDCSTGISDLDPFFSFSVFPNPFTEELTLTIDDRMLEKTKSIQLYNMLGECVYSLSEPHDNRVFIQRNNLPSGIYVLVLKTKSSVVKTQKISIE